MKKTKRTLVSMIVFLTIFCLPAIFNMQDPLNENKENPSKADAVVLAESDTFVQGTEDIEVQSFSNDSNSTNTFWNDQYLASNETQAYQAGTNNVLEDNSYTEVTDTSEEIAKVANVPTSNTEATNASVITEAAKKDTSEDKIESTSDIDKKIEAPKKQESLYDNIGISVADSFVNIRAEANVDSIIVGKLYKDAAAEILDTKDDWYHVESGSVKGYVKSEYIKTGIPDEALVEKYSVLQIIVDVDGLNVREKPDTDSKKLTVIYQNETYPVIELKDAWVKISITDDDVIGYINKEYANLLVDFKKAISREEEKELLELQAAERAKKETEIKLQESVSYLDSDLKLLACLVHSEAGTQSYEGKLAVANVVLNRMKSSKYPDTIKAVIYQPGQFTVATSGSLAKQLANYSSYCSTSQLLSIKAARAALNGANNIGTRLYFHSYKAAIKKGYDEKSTSVKLGDHLFW